MLIGEFRLELRIPREFELGGVRRPFQRWIQDGREELNRAAEEIAQGRSMKGLDIRRSKSERRRWRTTKGLPPHRKLRPLRLADVAVVFKSLRIIKLQAVDSGNIPARAGDGHAKLPINRPRVPVPSNETERRGARNLSRGAQPIRVAGHCVR